MTAIELFLISPCKCSLLCSTGCCWFSVHISSKCWDVTLVLAVWSITASPWKRVFPCLVTGHISLNAYYFENLRGWPLEYHKHDNGDPYILLYFFHFCSPKENTRRWQSKSSLSTQLWRQEKIITDFLVKLQTVQFLYLRKCSLHRVPFPNF